MLIQIILCFVGETNLGIKEKICFVTSKHDLGVTYYFNDKSYSCIFHQLLSSKLPWIYLFVGLYIQRKRLNKKLRMTLIEFKVKPNSKLNLNIHFDFNVLQS